MEQRLTEIVWLAVLAEYCAMNREGSPYHGYRYLPAIISYAVRSYFKFSLSFRNVEDLLAERGVVVSYETIRAWCKKFRAPYARRLRRRRGTLGDHWFLVEGVSLAFVVCITICGARLARTVMFSISLSNSAEMAVRPGVFCARYSRVCRHHRIVWSRTS